MSSRGRAFGLSVKRFVRRSNNGDRAPHPPPILTSSEDASDDEYTYALSLEPRKIEQPEKRLAFALFEDGIFSAVFFAQFVSATTWPFEKRHAIRDAILALDWIFEPDPEPYLYNFDSCADVLSIDADFWRGHVLKKFGIPQEQISTLILRGKLWLRKVHQLITEEHAKKHGPMIRLPEVGEVA